MRDHDVKVTDDNTTNFQEQSTQSHKVAQEYPGHTATMEAARRRRLPRRWNHYIHRNQVPSAILKTRSIKAICLSHLRGNLSHLPGSPKRETQAGRTRLCGKNPIKRRTTAAVVCPSHLEEGITGWLYGDLHLKETKGAIQLDTIGAKLSEDEVLWNGHALHCWLWFV